METKKATIYDVAKAAKVSPATVSRVINHQHLVTRATRDKVMEAMVSLHFSAPKPSERTQRPKSLINDFPLLLFNVSSFYNPFYQEIIRGAQAAADKSGFRLLIDCYPINGFYFDQFVNLIQRYEVAGVVVSDAIPGNMLYALNGMTPVVQCSDYNPDAPVSYVSIDNFNASKKAVEFILSSGRRKIVLFTTPQRFYYARLRRAGYMEALEEAGIEYREEWCLSVPEVDFDMAYQAAQRLFANDPLPDALFAVSDVLAAAAIKAALKAGLSVPGDLTVVGFDNVDISLTTNPTITTVSQPAYQMGYRSVEMLIEKILNVDLECLQTFLSTELIVRESSGI